MKVFCADYNNCNTVLIRELKRRDWLCPNPNEADVIVVWQDIVGQFKELVIAAKQNGIPVLMMEHGRAATAEYLKPISYPLLVDVFMVWGKRDYNKLRNAGYSKDRIKWTGTTLFSHLKPRIKHEGINVVFAPVHWDVVREENKLVSDYLKTLKGYNIITKHIQHDGIDYPNLIYSEPWQENHIDIVADVLSKADVIVGLENATFELLAFQLGIPVINVDILKPMIISGNPNTAKQEKRTRGGCFIVHDVNDIEKAIMEAVLNPTKYETEMLNELFLDGGIGNGTDPLKEVMSLIKKARKKVCV